MHTKLDQQDDIQSILEEEASCCHNCGSKWNSIVCTECGYDAYCYDQHYD